MVSNLRQEIEVVEKMLEKLIKTIPEVVEEKPRRFRRGKNVLKLIVRKDRVSVEPIGYYYRNVEELQKEEFELKGAIEGYLKYGYLSPRLFFEERREDNTSVLCCILEGGGLRIEFRPKWNELLNGVNQMVFIEYKNALKRKKNMMSDIMNALQKISRRSERLYKQIKKKA